MHVLRPAEDSNVSILVIYVVEGKGFYGKDMSRTTFDMEGNIF